MKSPKYFLISFNEALDDLEQNSSQLEKEREACHPPEIEDPNNTQQRRQALTDALTILSSIKPESELSESEVEEFISFFEKLYCNPDCFRHFYSDICNVMYESLRTDSEMLDDGIPYQARSLANKVATIYQVIDERSDVDAQVKRSVCKLHDHIELENTRMGYMARQNKALNENVRKLHKNVSEVDSHVDVIKHEVEKAHKNIGETQNRLQRNYVTILGIFAAVVIAFATGSAFSSAVLQSMSSVGIYRLTFIILVLGLFLFDLVMTLFFFICRVSEFQEGKRLPSIVIFTNVALLVGIAATIAARFFHIFG